MHILLVRHGQSTNNVIEAEVGDCPDFYQRRQVDPPLSSLGEQQAAALGRHLGAQLATSATQGRVHLACSCMARAMQTVSPLSTALGVDPLVRPDCVERHGFFSEDKTGTRTEQPAPTCDDVLRRFPKYDVSRLASEPRLSGSVETLAEARARAARVAAELLATARGTEAPELLVMVAHAGVFVEPPDTNLTPRPKYPNP